MQARTEDRVRRLFDDVVAFARERLPDAAFAAFEPFLRHYYGQADAEDVLSRSVADLYGAAMSHWQFARKFSPGVRACACTTRAWSSTAGIQSTR